MKIMALKLSTKSVEWSNNIKFIHPFSLSLSPSLPLSVSGFTSDHLSEFKRELNSAVLKDMRSNKDNMSVTVLAVDITRKESRYSAHVWSSGGTADSWIHLGCVPIVI